MRQLNLILLAGVFAAAALIGQTDAEIKAQKVWVRQYPVAALATTVGSAYLIKVLSPCWIQTEVDMGTVQSIGGVVGVQTVRGLYVGTLINTNSAGTVTNEFGRITNSICDTAYNLDFRANTNDTPIRITNIADLDSNSCFLGTFYLINSGAATALNSRYVVDTGGVHTEKKIFAGANSFVGVVITNIAGTTTGLTNYIVRFTATLP